MENTIYSINGPVVTIKGKTDLEMMEMVYVGKARLVGEVIRMNDKETTIQVYEETGGLKAGEPVVYKCIVANLLNNRCLINVDYINISSSI